MAAADLIARLRRWAAGPQRFPLATAWLLVALLALVGLMTAPQLRGDGRGSGLELAPSSGPTTLSGPIQVPPPDAIRRIQRALKSLDHTCTGVVLPPIARRLVLLQGPVAAVSGFVRKYPNARFRLQGESATTEALIVVVRSQLDLCAPSMAQALAPTTASDTHPGGPGAAKQR